VDRRDREFIHCHPVNLRSYCSLLRVLWRKNQEGVKMKNIVSSQNLFVTALLVLIIGHLIAFLYPNIVGIINIVGISLMAISTAINFYERPL